MENFKEASTKPKFWIGRVSDQIQGNYSAWAIPCGTAFTIEEARKLRNDIEKQYPPNPMEGYYIFNEQGEIVCRFTHLL